MIKTQVSICFALALLFPAPTRSQNAQPTSELARGIQLLFEGDLPSAVTALNGAIRGLSGLPGAEKDLAKAHFYLGFAHVNLSQWERGKAEMREAWRAPDPSIDPKKIPPLVWKAYEEAKAEVEAETDRRAADNWQLIASTDDVSVLTKFISTYGEEKPRSQPARKRLQDLASRSGRQRALTLTDGRQILTSRLVLRGTKVAGTTVEGKSFVLEASVVTSPKTAEIPRQGSLGIIGKWVGEGARQTLALKEPEAGVLVVGVRPESAASRADIRVGDVLLWADNVPLVNDDALPFVRSANEPMALRVWRNGEEKNVALTTGTEAESHADEFDGLFDEKGNWRKNKGFWSAFIRALYRARDQPGPQDRPSWVVGRVGDPGVGVLYLKDTERLAYRQVLGDDGKAFADKSFDVPLSQIDDIGGNKWYGRANHIFHVKLKNGSNYNFGASDDLDNTLNRDSIVGPLVAAWKAAAR